MLFGGSCSCVKHDEWHHTEQRDLRVTSFYEEKYCIPDTKHGTRKRKICKACRGRISVEEKCRKLTVEGKGNAGAGDCGINISPDKHPVAVHDYNDSLLADPMINIRVSPEGAQPVSTMTDVDNWKVALIDAIISGNDIHDDIFEGDAINVSVDEAVQIAGEECHVDKICQQYDIIGSNRLGQLINVFKTLAVGQPHSCHIVITGDRSMLFIVNQDKSSMIVDSHEHRGTGALIAYAPVGQVDSLALWFTRMHSATWDTEIGLTSLVSVSYVL